MCERARHNRGKLTPTFNQIAASDIGVLLACLGLHFPAGGKERREGENGGESRYHAWNVNAAANAPQRPRRKEAAKVFISFRGGGAGAGNRVSEIAVAGSFVAAVRLNRGERVSEHVCGERKVNYVSLTNSRVSEPGSRRAKR